MTVTPQTVDRFVIERQLRQHAGRASYRAHYPTLHRHFHLVLYPPGFNRERFLARARLARQIDHPNVAYVFDYGECEHGAYIAYEEADGASYTELLCHAPLGLERGLWLMEQLTDALAAAEAVGLGLAQPPPEHLLVGERHGEPDFLTLCDIGGPVSETRSPVQIVGDFGQHLFSRPLQSDAPTEPSSAGTLHGPLVELLGRALSTGADRIRDLQALREAIVWMRLQTFVPERSAPQPRLDDEQRSQLCEQLAVLICDRRLATPPLYRALAEVFYIEARVSRLEGELATLRDTAAARRGQRAQAQLRQGLALVERTLQPAANETLPWGVDSEDAALVSLLLDELTQASEEMERRLNQLAMERLEVERELADVLSQRPRVRQSLREHLRRAKASIANTSPELVAEFVRAGL